ncbi:MAG TPA: hypothetical protein VMJ10_14865 [Kofleriaceae bacterium]|nr:hypothetical protein [Kofleriaceae bacterium]
MSTANSALALAALAACGGRERQPATTRVGPALAASFAAADQTRAPWRCTADDLPALADEAFEAGGHRWTLHAHALHRSDGGDAGDVATIGFVADAGGAAPATLAALGRLRAQLDAAKPDVVVALGGMGASEPELEATLGVLAEDASFPVVALPGDLEPAEAERAALVALARRGTRVVDGRLARWIELPGTTLATIPGAGSSARLVAGADGCAWNATDVTAIYVALAAHDGLRVAASSEAPRELVAGEPTGDGALVPPPGQVDVVVHGPTGAAPTIARTGARDGRAAALSPGTSDATTRLPEPHAPSAGLLAVRGGTWTWRPVTDPTAAR